LDAKENALRIIRFESPERVARGLPAHDCSYFGVNHEPWQGVGGHDAPVGSRWRDIWGVGWQKELEGVMGFAREHPLSDLSGLDRYPFPSPDDPRLCQQIYDRAAKADGTKFRSGSHRETLWERCYNLVGMDNLMLAFSDDPPAVRALLRRVMDFQLGIARHYVSAGVEVAGLGDDLCSQRALLFSRDVLEEFFVPQYRRLCSFYQGHGVLITFHSCGHVEPILDVFMDLGVAVLNPVQASANNLDNVRRLTQGRMTLQGAVSTHTIMRGPAEAIRREVRTRLWQLGRDGGYFCGPDQGLPFPPEHIKAFDETIDRYGVYPLKPPEK
jgi:uroporphyrinogen decarboxylase